MTHPCCTECRVRFASDRVTTSTACPLCDGPLDELPAAEVLGYALAAMPGALAKAIAARLPHPAHT